MDVDRQFQSLLLGIVLDHHGHRVLAVPDMHETRSPDERLQSHYRLQRCRYNHLETKGLEDIHGHRRKFRIGLVECFIKNHGGKAW